MANLFTNLQQALAQGVKVCMIMNPSGKEITTGEQIVSGGTTAQIVSDAKIVLSINSTGNTLK